MKIFENFLKKDKVKNNDRWSKYRMADTLPDTYELGMNCTIDLIENEEMRQRIYRRIKDNPSAIEIDRDGKTKSLFGIDANIIIDVYNKISEEIGLSRPHIEKGIKLAKQEKHEDAIKSFDKAIEIDRDNAKAWLNRGHALGMLNRVDDSITSFNKAIELDSRIAELLKKRGLLDETGKKFRYKKDAISENDKKNAEILTDKGYRLTSMGKYKDAIKYLDDALKLDPRSGTVLLCKYICLDNLGRKNEAAECFRKIFDMDPKVAVMYLDILLKHEPNNIIALIHKGFLLNKLGRYEDAIKSFDEALTIDPNHPMAVIATDARNVLEIMLKNKQYMDNKANIIKE